MDRDTFIRPHNHDGTSCYRITISRKVLAQYNDSLGITDPKDGLRYLAQAIATSPMWDETKNVGLVVRSSPRPVIAIFVQHNGALEFRIKSQARYLPRGCSNVRYISYTQAQEDCEQLASRFKELFSNREIRKFQFSPIPRGGYIVLGILAYFLGLEPDQFQVENPQGSPLVIVDDCALTGVRFRDHIRLLDKNQIIFAHLYSHPALREAIETREPNVLACLGARDLNDLGPDIQGEAYPSWQQDALARLDGKRYWVGQTEHLCFAWSEPEHGFWNPVSRRMEAGWRLIPPELCLNNRMQQGSDRILVQVQPEGKGPIKPSETTVFCDFGDEVVLGHVEARKCLGLRGVAADIWRAIIEHGNIEAVLNTVLDGYDTDRVTAQRDLKIFVTELFDRKLL